MTPYLVGQKLAQEIQANREKKAFLPLLLAAGKAALPSIMWGGGLGAGIGALTAQPGERMRGALQGAGVGALSGGVAKGLSMGLKGVSGGGGLLNTPSVKSWMGAPNQSFLGKATRWGINKGSGEFGMSLASAPFMPGMGKAKPPEQLPMTNIPGYYNG